MKLDISTISWLFISMGMSSVLTLFILNQIKNKRLSQVQLGAIP